MAPPSKVNVVDPATGKTFSVDEFEAQRLEADGWTREGGAERAERLVQERREDEYGGVSGKVAAFGAGALRGVTLGASDLALRALGEGEDFAALREVNPGTSLVAEIGSAIATGKLPVPAGAASRLGARIAQAGEGAGTVARIGAAAKGAAAEGAIFGAGSGVSELALSKDPVTLERALSTIGSHTLFGGATGGAVGAIGGGAGAVLRRAKAELDNLARVPDVTTGDLAKLDAKGLRAAEKAERESLRGSERVELDNLRAAEKAELDAIEATRVGQRKDLADEIAAFRREVKEQKHFLTTDGVSLPAGEGKATAAELGRVASKANKQLDNVLDNPTGLAQNPGKALDALQRHEAAMVRLLDRADDLRTVYKADTTGARAAALDTIPGALEKNRALQAKITGLGAKPTSTKLDEIAAARSAIEGGSMKTSQRLDDIAAARDAVGGKREGFVEQMLGGTAFGAAASAIGAIPIVGQIPGLASIVGAKVAQLVNGGLGKAAAKQADRASKAIGMFLDAGKKAERAAPVLASKVLASVAFGARKEEPSKKTMSELFRALTADIKAQTMYDETGRAVMRPQARAQMAALFDGVRAIDPIAADRMETIAARRIEAISNRIPRRPDILSMHVGGPDRWQPSDMEMRAFARFVAAVEDPTGIVERLADGSVTPEDAEAMREVYPEMYMQIQEQILSELPTLRKTLPYSRRISLSIFSGIPVDPSMHPEMIDALQAQYEIEPGTDGGEHAPTPKPAFGSVKGDEPTAAQRRSA